MNRFHPEYLKLKYIAGGAIFFAILITIGMVAIILADQPQDRPDYNVKVVDFQPKEYLNIYEPTNIIIRFSREMAPDSGLNILFADVPLEIAPPVDGLGKWIDNNTLAFYPDSVFRPSTEYEINVKSSKTYLYGNKINEPRTFKIRTPTVTVTGVWTEIIDVPEPEFHSRLMIHVGFNYPVNPGELIKYFSSNFGGPGGTIPFEVTEDQPSYELTLISAPFRQQDVNGRFEFVISKGLQCVGGTIPLQADYRQTFDVAKPERLVVREANPEGAGANSRIIINLSQSVARAAAREYITISPKIDFVVDQMYNRIALVGNFAPRETYTIDIRKGLRSQNGQILERDFSTKVIMGDLPPRIKFLDQGVFLSREGGQRLAVETANIDDITVEVEQIFVNNIVYYLGDYSSYYGRHYYGEDISRLGRRIFSKDYKLAGTLNVPLTSTIDIGKIVGDTLHGIYSVSVRRKDQRWTYDQRRVMISDLGILARLSDNYLMVWVNSLGDTKPVSGAEVTLLSRNNQILLSGKTDSKGIAVFENIIDKTKGFEPFVITVSKGNDLSFLQFSQCLIPTADFDVSGRPYLTHGYEAFIYSDRGVYRPGETAHIVSVLRGRDGAVPEEFPYLIKITDPQGRDFKSLKLSTKDAAMSAVDIPVPDFAKTGSYAISAKIGDEVIGSHSIQVEEFMPDRIKTTIETDKDTYKSGDEAKITANGIYLFGPPASGNRVSGHITIEPDIFRVKGFSEYTFADFDKEFSPVQVDLPEDRLGDAGEYVYSYRISPNLEPPSALSLQISATVLEDGGRAVSAYKTVRANPYAIYLGLKQNFQGYAVSGKPASFSVIALNPEGQAVPETVMVRFYRTVYQNIVRQDNQGIFRYVSEAKDEILDSALAVTAAGPATLSFIPPDYGAYKIRAVGGHTRHTSILSFYAPGWGFSPWSMANPEKIELELDKKLYSPGDKARLLVKAPFEGKLLLTVEKDKVLELSTYDLDSNTATIEVPIKKEYFPNAYVSATLIKSTTSLERFSPARAFGLVPVIIESSGRKLGLSLEAPEIMKPREKLEIKIKTDLKKGARLTLAVVDIGILQLTGFATPDPFEFFYGKKRPGLSPYDIYSLLYPDVPEAESKLSPGGSAAYDAARKRHLNPINVKRVKPLALWSGVITVGNDGMATVSFDIPQFNGKLAVMAVGFSGEMVGSATREVTVRDKIVIQESLPRFIAGEDKITTGVTVFNNTGKSGDFKIAMEISGPARLLSEKIVRLSIPDNGKAVADFSFAADEKPGKVTFDIVATNGIESSHEKVELANRPGKPLLTKHGAGSVRVDSSARLAMPADWIEGTAQYELRLASNPAVKLAGGIQYLLSYPYGCIEQTTSKLFPMLYFGDLARFIQPEIFGTQGHDYYLAEGIMKISSMQLPNGEFVYWPGWPYVDPWGSVYASHFLVEARKAGYEVNDDVYDRMIGNLRKVAREPGNERDRGIIRIYAAYALALAGELDKSVVSNLKLLNLELAPLYTKFQLAGAIALTNGIGEALYLIPAEIHPLKFEPETGGYFDSDIRANAILLNIISDIAPDNPSIPELVKNVSESIVIGHWYTTQSNAWALMALGKFFKSQETPDYTGSIIVDGKKYRQFGIDEVRISDPSLANKNIEISINGKGTCYYYWQASGVSSERAIREFDNRIQVRRAYLDIDGNPLKLEEVKLGQQVVAKITVEALDKALENVAVNDLLASCFEIENPRLQTSARVPDMPEPDRPRSKRARRSSMSDWMPTPNRQPSYLDIRDDRLLLFVNLAAREKFVYLYSLRVTSRGDFIVPPIGAECMYDPTIASSGSSGYVKVAGER